MFEKVECITNWFWFIQLFWCFLLQICLILPVVHFITNYLFSPSASVSQPTGTDQEEEEDEDDEDGNDEESEESEDGDGK